ncbi:dehydrogenase [Mycolicibacterium chitae]|uniref:Dehydrogenase n=1 Tax=Mycolicibacterium chitae TaxID=1792 RepID=A0A448IAY9_MYCCI|nr:mycofactocin system GMC family oxidoreductase MftG [Mycolicibacterium chitae]MCV7108446.1 mycofactocin system GMC family oxidoreductase MftG [Mycolicibacterium chitae]BBZ00679.1 dehydrogenase [Mycolicibacterium chitae]VEG49527.1 dehydrogenase [Mycolicibacterium chitae]
MSPRPTHSDVLVIGAGSAGSVVAERLSADPACSVTVLELGPGPSDPGVAALTDNGTVLPVGAGSPLVARFPAQLTDSPARTVQLVRGATVGGSGAVNGGYFCRAVPADFAAWDLPGWGWDDVLPHYRAIETDLDFTGPQHGDRGPIRLRRTAETVGSTALFLQATARYGYPWLPDLNDGAAPGLPTGIGPVPLNIVDGVRVGPGAGFLVPALGRPNLTVFAGLRVLRLRFAGTRAVGVDAVGPDGPQVFTADRIVLCAGAIGSAHLLMLSGIGDDAVLRALGIATVQQHAVGARCSDHPEWVLPTSWAVEPRRPVLEVVLSLGGDLEIRPYTGGFVAMLGDGTEGRPDWPHLGVALMQPRSRGALTLASADPAVPPRIAHHYDSEPADVARLRHGAELAYEITGATTGMGEPSWSTSQHLCGSVPMGAEDDPYAVLDEQCRVRGVERLWVIDGSVMPRIPSRGPHATTVMLAHRAAPFVLS